MILRIRWSRPATLSLLASAALLGAAACAQDATAPTSPALPPDQPLEPLTAQPATLFRSFRLGPVDVQPRCKTGVTYDDNILISSPSEHLESDLIWFAQPAFLAVAGDRLAMEDYLLNYDNVLSFSPSTFIVAEPETWPGSTAMLDYGPRFNAFTAHPENDSIDQFLTFNGLWPMSRMILGVQQGYVLENTTIIEAGRRSLQENIPTALLASYQFSEKTSADLKLSRTSISYEDQQALADYTDWNWDNWFNYQYSALLNLSVGVNVGLVELPSQPGQNYETPTVRARYHYGTRLVLEGSAGLQLRQYDGTDERTTEPVFNVTACYQASEKTTLRLTAFRRELPSVSYGYDYIATGGSVGFQQRVGERWLASVATTYYTSDYLATAQPAVNSAQARRTDNYIEVRPALDVRFTRHWYGRLFYCFRTVQSGQWAGWTDNQVGTEVTWTF